VMTSRDLDVLCLLAAGFTSAETAARLCISPHTVIRHISQMMQRTGSATRTELVARAISIGAIDVTQWPPTPTGKSVPTRLSA